MPSTSSAGRVETLPAAAVVLATGGVGKVYRYTTNPETSTGDGIAMAWRAGCRVANMEFIQFHPTCLYHPAERSFLITEALRGEGAQLKLPDGTRFMAAHDARMELAPRDIVARAIDFEMKRHGLDYVLARRHAPRRGVPQGALPDDPRPLPGARASTSRASRSRLCRRPTTRAAAWSPTSTDGPTCPGLYAVGETAYTGLHGANRLASNSLLECVVIGRSLLRADRSPMRRPRRSRRCRRWDESRVEDADEQVVISHNWDELRLTMWNYVGIVRTTKRLERALRRIQLLRDEIDEYYADFRVNRDLLELRNLVDCAELVVRSALARHESRGLHFSRDYPHTLPGCAADDPHAPRTPAVVTPQCDSRSEAGDRAASSSRPPARPWSARRSRCGRRPSRRSRGAGRG